MTNLEKHYDEIMRYKGDFCVLKNGKIASCPRSNCYECMTLECNTVEDCQFRLFNWLFEESKSDGEK